MFTKTLTSVIGGAVLIACMIGGAHPVDAATMRAAGVDQPGSSAAAVVVSAGINIVKLDSNPTALPGLAFRIVGASPGAISISGDGQRLSIFDAVNGATVTSQNSTLENSGGHVAAKFVQVGSNIVITPVESGVTSRAKCGSSFWGNTLFNVGMAGVCTALAVGTVVGGVVCSTAVIAANTQIDWDSHC